MGYTFSEKILAEKSGHASLHAGEIVMVSPDFVMSHDNAAAISKTFAKMGVANVKHPEGVVIILDHVVPAASAKHAENHKVIRQFVADQGIVHFHDINTGICHQVFAEQGYALPGTLILGSDSHTTTYGAFGAFSAGIGRTEVAAIWATGQIWLRVPETIRIVLKGTFPTGVSAKDLALKIIGDIGADGALYQAVEFTGPLAAAMSIAERMVLANMAAEMGAKNGYFAADARVNAYLAGRTHSDFSPVTSDRDAQFARELTYDVSGLRPQVAKPHTVDNVSPVDDVAGTPVQQALLGTCTNGRLEDLAKAAKVLENKRVAPGVRMLVFPASWDIYSQAMEQGILATFIRAGAVIMNPGCGPCLGAHAGVLADGEVCISSANRNFKGRMGNPNAYVYLANPEVVAASAVAGSIQQAY